MVMLLALFTFEAHISVLYFTRSWTSQEQGSHRSPIVLNVLEFHFSIPVPSNVLEFHLMFLNVLE